MKHIKTESLINDLSNFEDTKKYENQFIVKHNKLIEARYNLSINEQRVLIYLLSSLDLSKQEFSTIEISARKIMEMFDMEKSGNAFYYVEEACKKLFNHAIDISQEEGKEDWVHWFNRIKYKRGSGIITAEFHPELKPY